MGRRATGTIEARTNCIRLKFPHLGERKVETLDLKPTEANLKHAKQKLAKIMYAIEIGTYRREDFFDPAPGKSNDMPTFKEWSEQWLETWVQASSTKTTYKKALRNSWWPHFGDVPVADIKPSDIAKAVAARHKQIAANTINVHLAPLRECLEAACKDFPHAMKTNPAADIRSLRFQRGEPDPFTIEERELVLNHMRRTYDEQAWNYFVLAFHTGMRPCELIALRWDDVDWRARQLSVSRARVNGEEKAATKTYKPRTVDLSDAALAALTRQKAHTALKNHGYVLENPVTRNPWTDESAQRVRYFVPTLKALGLRHRDCYQCRHTFATTLLMGGVKPAYISRQLGHTNLKMLFNVYGRWLDGADGGAEARQLNEVLSRTASLQSPNSPQAATGD